MSLVQSKSSRVDKRSASTFLSWHGGCATLIHPTYFAENKFSLHTYPTRHVGCVPRTDDDGAWNASYMSCWVSVQGKFVLGEICRVGKRSASTMPAQKGGCATLIHPTTSTSV